jgi:hypothetical protein
MNAIPSEGVDDVEDSSPNDALRHEIRARQKFAERYIIVAAKLIAPVIEKSEAAGRLTYHCCPQLHQII